MIFINFKTYEESTGEKAVALAKIIEDAGRETGIEIIPAPQTLDFEEVKKAVSIPVWTQHVDPSGEGKFTGWFSPEAAFAAGAQGTFLNHSEHKITFPRLSQTVAMCREVGLQVLIFAGDEEEAKHVSELKPDLLAYEPPELVGSRTTSVAEAKPDVIQRVVQAVAPLPVVVGAGIHSREDIEVSTKLGAVGVAVATDVVLAENPRQELLDLVRGF